MKAWKRCILVAVLFSVLLMIHGCGSEPSVVQPPAPEVTVSKPLKKDVILYLEYTGNIVALQKVEIRARVAGFLEKINFTPRSEVKANDLLFVIDPKPYRAKVDQALATVAARKASLNLAQVEYEKARQLESKDAISQIKLVEQTAKRDVAKAELAQAQADLEAAELDLEYTHVKAPISGHVGRNLVDVGSLVGAQEKTLLTTVVNDKSVYVYFSASEQDLLPLIRKEEKTPAPKPLAFMGLSDEKGFPHEGYIDFFDTEIDPSTGTMQIRAVFPNDNGLFLPGMFVRIRVPVERFEAILVPDSAIQAGQGGKFVLVVNENKVVEQRIVRTGQLEDRMRVILDGLKEQDWVIVNGIRRARPGQPVKTVESQLSVGQPEVGATTQQPKK